MEYDQNNLQEIMGANIRQWRLAKDINQESICRNCKSYCNVYRNYDRQFCKPIEL